MKQRILFTTTITILAFFAISPAIPASMGQPTLAEAKARKVVNAP